MTEPEPCKVKVVVFPALIAIGAPSPIVECGEPSVAEIEAGGLTFPVCRRHAEKYLSKNPGMAFVSDPRMN